MKINNKWLKKWNACPEGIEWFNKYNFKNDIELLEALMKHNLDWVNWTITKLFNRKQRIQYTVYIAKLVLPIFEKEYPDDKRPREAIEATIKCIDNNTEENRDAAKVAAGAAYLAASRASYRAAYMVAEAIYWASYSAAYMSSSGAISMAASMAAEATEATYWASYWASYSAAYNVTYWATGVTRATIKKKILNYGIKLLKGEE